MVIRDAVPAAGAERRLKNLGIELPPAPIPPGAYVEAVEIGDLLFLSGRLPVIARTPQFIGRLGAELSVEAGQEAARIACLNAPSAAKVHLGMPVEIEIVLQVGD